MAESSIIAFYRGIGTDHTGRRIGDILAWDHRKLELAHDYIQWLFPLPEPSRFNPHAPLLTADDIATFRAEPTLRQTALQALDVLLTFLGLHRIGDAIDRSPAFAARAQGWLEPANHNHLRLTRIIQFLRLIGLEQQSKALLACLEDIARQEGRGAISARTLAFWRDAARLAG